MNVDATFLPVATDLVDNVFGTNITFHRHIAASFNPMTGTVSGGLPPVIGTADYVNDSATCYSMAVGDYEGSNATDGVTSLCDDLTLPAGAIAWDDADITPRADIGGASTPVSTDLKVKAGILNRSRVEEGGPNEAYEIAVWIHHGASCLPFLPTTQDTFTYDSVVWKVTEVNPTYSATGLIASKIKGRTA